MSKKNIKSLVPKLRFPEFLNDSSWDKKPFSKLFKIGSGKDYKHLLTGNIPVFGSGGYMLSVNSFLYDGESACIGRKGTINNPIFLTGKFWTVDTLFYTHSFEDCLPMFVFRLFQNVKWMDYNEAGGVPSLSKIIINKIEVAIPELPEQQKIVDCLSSIDNLIDKESKKLEDLKAHKKGLMQKLFPAAGKNIPEFRFPEFKHLMQWKIRLLNTIADRVFLRNANNKIKRVLTNSAAKGVVDQRDFFEKDIANKNNLDNYFIVDIGDYVYNPRISKIAPVGPISKNNIAKGVMSPLYAVFRFYNTQNDFFEQYFKSSHWYQYIQECSNTGARHDRMNIPTHDFMDMPLPCPDLPEQQKIADCLSSIDNLIEAQSQKIDALKDHKKGLMQQIFPSIDEEGYV